MKKIIITGGLGYIGSLLAEKLIQDNYEVFIFDNFFTNIKSKIKGAKFIKCDITKAFQLNNIKIKNIDTVLHLAGQSSGPKSYKMPEQDVRINIIGTVNMIKFCAKNSVNKFIFASTFAVYGDPIDKIKLNENVICNPKSFYGISKYTCEKYVKGLCEKFSIKWNILRMFNVYGVGQDLTRRDQGMVSIYLDYIKNSNYLPVNGSLERFRDLIYIEDVLQAWFLCLKDKKNPNQIFNVGSGKKTYVKTIIKEIIMLYKKKKVMKVKEAGSTPGDIMGCYADISKIKKLLKFKPKYNFKKGVKIFKEWADLN